MKRSRQSVGTRPEYPLLALDDDPAAFTEFDGAGLAQDPILGVDVGVGVRVEHQLDAELLIQDPAQLVGT
jgi:hypothetical protein